MWRVFYGAVAGLTLLASLAVLMTFATARTASRNGSSSARQAPSASTTPLFRDLYANAPLRFERNDGQTDARVKFIARGNGYTLFLTGTAAVFALRKSDPPSHRNDDRVPRGLSSAGGAKPSAGPPAKTTAQVLKVKLVGANPLAKIEGTGRLSGNSSYFVGNDPKNWRAGVPSYAKVRYRDVYPGIDLVYYGTGQRQLEYDFVLAPGADPKAIALRFAGAKELVRDSAGDVIVHLADDGEMLQRMPAIYQERGGRREKIDGKCVIRDKNTIGSSWRRMTIIERFLLIPG